MHLQCTLFCSISRYLALSRNVPVLWRIFATANGKRETIHPLRFARRPCLRGTVSYCLLMQKQDGTTQCDAIFIYCMHLQRGMFLSSSFLSPFLASLYPHPFSSACHMLWRDSGCRVQRDWERRSISERRVLSS